MGLQPPLLEEIYPSDDLQPTPLQNPYESVREEKTPPTQCEVLQGSEEGRTGKI